MTWKALGGYDPKALGEARLQSHHAVQLITRLARGYLPAADDDSHTNLGWDHAWTALVGRPLSVGDHHFDLGLRVQDLTLLWHRVEGGVPERFPLEGRAFDDADAWVRSKLDSIGLDPAPFAKPLHFEIPPHPVAEGAPFSYGDKRAFLELSAVFGDAASVIDDIRRQQPGSSEVRCWPHHFDIATLITLGGSGEDARTIGFGMSPGDSSYSQPYFYVNPWPYPDASKLPPPAEGSHWHTDGWTGSVVTIESLAGLPTFGQKQLVANYATETINALRKLLST